MQPVGEGVAPRKGGNVHFRSMWDEYDTWRAEEIEVLRGEGTSSDEEAIVATDDPYKLEVEKEVQSSSGGGLFKSTPATKKPRAGH